MRIQCPTCEEHFLVTVKPEDARKRVRASDSPITPAAMRSVLEFMRQIGPGRYTNPDLYDRYGTFEGQSKPYVDLSQRGLVIALKQNGATRWRDAKQRGWIIPEIPDEQKPASVAPSTRERVVGRGGGAGTIDSTGMVVGSLEWVNLINAQRGVDPSPPPGFAADDRSKNLLARFAREARGRELAELEAQRENL